MLGSPVSWWILVECLSLRPGRPWPGVLVMEPITSGMQVCPSAALGPLPAFLPPRRSSSSKIQKLTFSDLGGFFLFIFNAVFF